MIIILANDATDDDVDRVVSRLTELGLDTHRSDGTTHTVIGAIGQTGDIDSREFEMMEGVRDVVRISEPFKRASRSFHPERTIIRIGDVEIGGTSIVVMAGPCAVESKESIFENAESVAKSGAKLLRGGAFKPRTSPYSFQGLGEEGLIYMREAADTYNMGVISEVMDASQITMMKDYVDIFQLGARNMQNYTLLKELGKHKTPVLLKRGLAATIEEWLMSAEYIMAGGNPNVILCERGIRTFEPYTRNTMDISAIPIVQKLSHLPIVADPSHGTGRRDKVRPLARAAVAAGADGIIVEVHKDPDRALSDGAQSLYPEQFDKLINELKIIATAVGRNVN